MNLIPDEITEHGATPEVDSEAMQAALEAAPIPTHGTEQPKIETPRERHLRFLNWVNRLPRGTGVIRFPAMIAPVSRESFQEVVARLSRESPTLPMMRPMTTDEELTAIRSDRLRWERLSFLRTAKNYQLACLPPRPPHRLQVLGVNFAPEFSPGNRVQLSGFSNPENNGVYEIQSARNNTVRFRAGAPLQANTVLALDDDGNVIPASGDFGIGTALQDAEAGDQVEVELP